MILRFKKSMVSLCVLAGLCACEHSPQNESASMTAMWNNFMDIFQAPPQQHQKVPQPQPRPNAAPMVAMAAPNAPAPSVRHQPATSSTLAHQVRNFDRSKLRQVHQQPKTRATASTEDIRVAGKAFQKIYADFKARGQKPTKTDYIQGCMNMTGMSAEIATSCYELIYME